MSNDVMNGVPAELARSRCTYAEDGIEAVLRQVTLLHQAFELRAAAEPDAVVLVVGEERITCGELDAKANQLARFLVEQGVGPEVRVAICAERGAEMVVAMYAVLKAGGTYVPIDPAYPEERQANILADSGALLLLTQERLAGHIPKTSAKSVFLDRDWPRIELYGTEPLPPLADERNLAYVIYTSGSTGRPKGVAIAHRSAVILTRWCARIFPPEELAGVLGSTSICFDMSIFELFVTPALGGRVILADHALSLPDLPAAGEVTLINTVPSASAELARSGGIPPSVITVNLGGEALRSALVERLYALESVRKIYNLYGPSEDTTYSTWALMKKGDPQPPSVGRLLDGSWGYLLDRDLDRVPGGEPGELYLAGEGLSRGYLGRPDMTAARFLPDPFAVCPGERMYATGDLIRYRQDGELDYLGRIDHQVKIRGFRVELGEIEATLERHPTIGDTVVVALELDGGGETADRVLVAYVVPKPGATISVPELREFLREQLAVYMVPAHFVVMAVLPLNPNGKVDRKALPKPEISGERPGLVAPRTPLEAALAEIWSEVLSLSRVGVEDHFFELGGHSLLAARVIARIHDTLGRRLPPRALFDAPTIERLAALLTGLPAGEELEGIPVAPDRSWIVSAGQEGMWFSERLNAGLPIFTIPLLLDLEGPLDPGALQRSLAEIVRRHGTLRVVFSDVEGELVLALADAVVDLPRIDLTALPGDLRSRETEHLAMILSAMHIGLERAPLLQGYLIARDERDHRLLIGMHHIAGDDWSTWVLAHDLAALYAADLTGRPAALPPLPLQFLDYAAWQQDWLAGAEAREQLAFWRRRLAGSPEALDLPTDRPRPPLQDFAGGLLIAALPPRDTQALLGIALRSNATFFMAILAILDILLYRYAGQEDLNVGASTANRHRSGTQGMIGLFTNTVVLRADLRGEPGFGSLLEQVRETVLEGLDRQDFPFDRLVRELRPERRLSHPALAQVFLSFQNIPPLPRQLGPGLDLRVHELGNGTSKTDLTLYLRQEGETFVTAWEYASALFDATTIDRMAGHFQRLLAAAVADPARPISELPLLTIAEEDQISLWSEGVASPLEELTLPALFARQSARTPEAPAVIAEGGVLSYAELAERSDLLARHLRDLGVGPEILVGLCLERSLEMVVALLAVLKAGGAYVPLDPEYPAERLALMLTEADVHLVLTQGRLLHVLPEPSPVSIVDLDADWLSMARSQAVRATQAPMADGDGLAYAIFTSGSTGRPKGVAIPQRAIVNHMLWMQAEFPLGPGDRVLQKTPFSFDASIWEFYAPLLAGATLVMAKPGGQRELAYLVDAIRRYGITIFQAVPPLLRAMLDDKRLGECRSLRRVFCGGEALTADIQRDFFAVLDAELINLYGPTETTVEVTSWRCERWRVDRTALLGRPITNSRLYVLNQRGEPCPAGVPGEICVGGLPVGRGYLGQPGETAVRFVPDRFGGTPGARFYRTGDLGRWLPDGTLEFLGRTDHQVKVRGFRIELGEVEAMVAAHPAVAESAVLVAGQRLAAYAALRPDAVPVQVAELRDFLLERLPEYMVPTSWILLEALPHTPSGKVDRRALSGLQPEEAEELPVEEAPRNPIEERLAAVWIELLDLKRVGVHQKFFEIGGHSLLAIQLISRIRRDFGIEVAIRQIFETPTIAGLASIIKGLPSSNRSAAMLHNLSYESGLPLSYGQSRLWFLHQLQPDSAVYNLPCLLRLRGRLDPGALDRALVEIVRRHEALRTTFFAIGGEPFQLVSVPRSSWLTRVDLSALPEGRRAAEVWRQAAEAYAQPFHLATGPLMHAALFQSGPEEGLLSLTVHHIASDGWSTEILLRELFTLYGAFLAGEPSPLPELPLQYPAFARWQRQWLSGEMLEKQLAYWRRRLEGAPRLLGLPSDRSRPAVRSSQGRLLKFALPEGLAHSLRERAKSLDVTPFMLFAAAYEALLGRYTDQDCLLVGTPVANRNWAEIEGLIGFFINTLVLRADLGGDPEFRHTVERVREATLDAQAHQDLPFEKLVEALQPERALSHTPLVQVMLVFQGAPAELPLPSGLAVDVLEPETRSAKVDLTLSVQEERDGGLKLELQYSTDLFDPATIRRMAGHFETLLTGAVHRPYLRLSELPLLTAPEVDQILVEWNGEPGVPPVSCVHELFALQAERTPDAPAVRFEEEVLTYRELDTRAEALARRLRRSGGGRERTVAVCVERSPAMVVAILGVLKAGGAYVPLDAESPRDRLGFVLEDCGARVLLSQDTLLEVLPPFSGPVVLLTAEGLLQGEPEKEDLKLDEPAGLERLAYVIYTSGSTGSPKGVMVGHGQLASYLSGVLARMSLPAGASFATVSTLAADLGNTVIFASLVTGGCLHVISRSRLSEAAALADAFERHPLDCLKIVPSHLTALLTSPRAAGCLPRRLLILGGEAVPPGLIQRVLELAPGCRILNHYGPTETTVGVLTQEIGRRTPIPLGRPLAGTRVLVLDRSLCMMPSGVPGELYVGGPQVTRGYLRQPGLTAERFVPDPWGAFYGQPGSRLYATGDRGRYLADGAVEFLGRVDFQVKVRGFRVEPGEVEVALRLHPGVGEAVVIARDQRLTAYVVALPGMELTASDLRAFLKERLPDPLVPTSWAFLPALPLTSNGKVDRKALPAPDELRSPVPSASPSTPTEELLATLWAGVLGLDRVGIHESFFELGGHSLLAIQVVSRVRESFGVELPLQRLFENPTVAGLSGIIDSAKDLAVVEIPRLEPAHRGRPLAASFAQESFWILNLLDPSSHVYNLPLAWRLSGRLSAAALEIALEALVRRHEALRTHFVEIEGRPYQEISAPAALALPWIDLSKLPEEERRRELERIVSMTSAEPFDLGRGPLLRVRFVILGADENALLLTMHHAVFDGWSGSILNRELAALYGAAADGREPGLPALPAQYADFSSWQRNWLRGAVMDRLLDWWRDELRDAPTALELTADRPRPPIQTFRGGWEELEVPPLLAAGILDLGRREGATTFITLLALFQALLHRLSGQDDLLVGAPVANRPLPELETLIGCFVDSVVLRSRFDRVGTFSQHLGRVRETVLNVFSRQHLPFAKLASSLPLEHDPSRNPIFQVLFSLDAPASSLALPGLSVEPLSMGEPSAKLDLSLGVREEGEGLWLNLEYNLDLFDPATARRILESFVALLAEISQDPGRRLDAVPLLPAAALRELCAEASRTIGLRNEPHCLHDLFSVQAARRPEALAVLSVGGERLTYGEVDRLSSRLARFLIRRGIVPETPVGVCLERSPEMLIAFLGVLKAGGVYLPLDPAYPVERLAFMLEDSEAPLVLIQERLLKEIPAGRWKTVSLDGQNGPLVAEEKVDTALAARGVPESLAYLIYTSGSTGRPKGVGIPHAAAAEHMEIAAGLFGFQDEDRMLSFSSLSFDASIEEIFAPLVRGAAVVLRDTDLWSSAELVHQVARLGVTALGLPTAYWQHWMADCEQTQPPSNLALRLVVLGGEAMLGEAARRWWRSPFSGISLVNAYGPTEGVITSTALVVDSEAASSASGTVPIGRALPGRSTWVLDRFGHPVPAGVAGELCLGGPLMARGYLGRPELTAERFVPDPFAGSLGGRLYRTGDLARRRPDGVLEFLGRVDRQLKVRGFRIEPGEIESVLERHPAVGEVAVDVRADSEGSPRLMAWIVPADPAEAPRDLAGFLSGTLPDHMIPSVFVTIAELPLTPNGKVNLRALPAPEIPGAGDLEAMPPRTPVEERLATLWEKVLGLPRVGVQENFFALGGHSLLATRLLSRVRDTFGVGITFRDFLSAPTIEAMAAIVVAASAWQEVGAAPAPGETWSARPERLLLSFSQQSLWLVERLQPAGGAYNLPTTIRLEGALDVAALTTALGGIVSRHESLRTRFVEIDGEPWQEILPAPAEASWLPLTDLSGLPEGRREEEALRAARAEAGRAFDLTAGSLLRALLVRLGPAEHLFLLVIHHAVSDGWSDEILLSDLAIFYQAAVEGRPAELPRLPLQYADYAIWQRQHLRGETLAKLLEVWRRQLAGVPPIDLPTDRRRPPVWTFRGASRGVDLEVSAADLDGLARSRNATSFIVALTVFQALLGRYTGQNDFAVGTPSANRTRYEYEGLVGFFVNMLPLRADLSGAPVFGELLTRVRDTTLEAFASQDLPFELLVEDLAPDRDLGRNPLFQVVLQFGYAQATRFPGLAVRRFDLGGGTAKFDLNLSMEQEDGRLALYCEYPLDLFEDATIQRLLGHFQVLLAAGLAEPGRVVGDLPLLAEAEREQLLVGFNDTGSTFGPEVCLHELFEAQVERTPERTALVDPAGVRLSYRELDTRAERLAHRLQALGLGPERLAGVLMDRTADLVVTLLAIQKAGGAYAPLDPNYPQSRVLLMLETARATVLVTRRRLAAAFEGDLPAGMRKVFLDPGWEMEPVESVASQRTLPDNLAYVIFTSGSTGVPKGVAIQHRSAVAMVRWAHTMYTPEEYAGVLASTSICFDMSVFEIFATLAAGGKIVLAENALALPELAARDEVVLVDTVPSAMSELLRLGGLPSTIRTVNLGGEALKGSLVQEIYGQLPSVERVVNLYGPSEDTTFTSYAVVPCDAEHPLIGRPLTGEAAYVLDAGMRPVPIGIPGALYMGGEGVTRGYLHRPDLTAERFVPNPYGPPGSRLYQVGDLVRYLPTGELDFLGRLDTQVKVRGFRIELGEIESALTRHPEVREAAVLAMTDAAGGNRLVAYVESARDLSAAELRSLLKQDLPDYMVPSVFVPVRALPLTPNGKIDRRALAALPLAAENAVVEDRSPQGYIETVMVGIWSRILGHAVGVNDHFFDLGGHSLLAARVTARVREAFGVDLPLRLLFEQPILSRFAASVEAALGIATPSVVTQLRTELGVRPLSFAQRRLWFLDQLLPDSAVYNLPCPLDLDGRLDVGALARSLSEVVRRHQALRTTFPSRDGEPYQEIAPAGQVPLPLIDLSGLPAMPESLRSAEAVALTRMDMLRPFDLVGGPLLRAEMLRLGPERHRLLLTMHHIVSDGWSIDILWRELFTLYEAFAADRPSPLPELPMQYADFAAWQRRWLTGETFSRQLDFWRAELAGIPAGLDLPTDFPRPAVQTFNGAVRSTDLPVALSAHVRELCRREGVTLFMLLLAGLNVLLARYSGQEDVLVGSPVANRHWTETEDLIGFFVNTLVFRARLRPVDSFRSVLCQVRATALEAFDHQDLPFETLVEELKPERDLSRSPFFQVLLLVQTLQQALPAVDHLQLSPVDEEVGIAKFDLSLVVLERESSLWAAVDYNTDLFAGATAQRLLSHLERLLAAAVSNPERDWRDLPLLAEAEREQLLVGFNDTGATSGSEACLHQLFEAQVERTPERTALVDPDGMRLSYRELNDRADRLACRLRALGLGPERLAGVLMDRTADLVVTLLAVHKAGGAYAPLDPNYPQSRVLLMLETSRAAVLVTRRRLAAAFEGNLPAGLRTVFLDPGWEMEPVESVVSQRALPDNLAYVIFTSGSTGVPKGVAIQHRSAVAMVRWAHTMYTPEEYAGVLASTSISFDMSVFEIFATLAAGGKILLAENALALPELASRDEVVLVDTVPSAMSELLRLGRLSASIRTVNLGGEALKGSLVREIYERLPTVERVVNLYGPSEDTTFTSYAVVPRDGDHPLIGRPLTGEAAYVVDAGMQPVPLGVPGALYMGGEGVTRGYLHRPDLTAERFIPNPYGPPGSRLYQVGDLVRYLPSGELDFLGRLDHQVKVRGFRVELGEIESALTRHPEVREAAVLAMPDAVGGTRLIAFVEMEQGPGELRAFLKRSLPEYMVPSAFVPLRALPLTPNGKIDRRALAALPIHAEGGETAGSRAPRNHVEEVLAGIWGDVFGQAVGVTDNFFDLGGHSLLATRVVSRVRTAFAIELPVRRLFEQPTIAGLAESVEAALGVGGALELPPVEPALRNGPLPLSFSQRRLWFLDQLDPGSEVYNIPYPLSLEGRLDPEVLRSAFAELVRRHEALRTTFPSLDGEPYQAIGPAGPFHFPVIDLGGLPMASRQVEAAALVERDSLRPFDLGAGPLFRAALLRLEPERHMLLLAMHHIVSDAWSLEILLRELAALYETIAAGRPSALPELPVQYADFAVWQRRWLSGEALSRQLEHWRRQLAGAPAGLDLPTDFPRPAVQTFKGASHSAALPAELSAGIRAFCRREGVTLFMLLLAGFDVLLARYSGQEDVLVGSPVANRNRAETEGLIGFFVNTLVLRVQLGAAASFRDALRQAREAALAAYGHQDLPFETLVEELRPERDLSRSPFFQELLSVQTAGPGLPDLGALKLAGIDGETSTAKFDLSLFVVDAETALRAAVEYNTDLFEGATAVRLLGHIGRLLAAAVSDPERGWRDLPLLTEAEREQLLMGFNDTGATSGPELCLHQLFEAQAEQMPERTALVAPDGERLSYRELNERADRLASRLRVLGLGPERLAGVLMDRTADLVVTLLAVHKAGGAYAPLDPNYPQSRVLLMLETSRAAVLVTRRGLAEAFSPELPAGLRTVFLDPGWEMEPVDSVVSQPALPDNLAYVIFTSGSTGVPKGVAIQHRSAVAMVRWAHTMYTPEEYAGVLASTSISFDMSVFEIFATLAAGGKILLAENALALPELASRDEVVLIDTVPSAMSELLRLGRLPASIRTVNLGGEALKGSLVREIYERLPTVERVVNLYGPSEDTTFTSYAVVPRDGDHPLIGRPLTGEAAYVLDAGMRPVPIGIPGALYMGGEGVTRGYLHRPDLTAERFIPNPYGLPGSRLYQVGDLVRYLSTGELDFLGRLDTQVKVRGFRIELGEIESALTRHPEVREAAVLAMPEEAGGNRLVAYVESARDLAAGELRSLLKQSLPDYMVPSAFVLLRELPLTPNGKIDRRALAAMPLHAEEAEAAGSRAPRNYVEEVLAGIWSDVFGQAVGVADNFFDLGGHSLLATRVVSRIRAALHVELPLHQVFAAPTVESLADWIGREIESHHDVPLPPIERVSREAPGALPLSLAQQRLWFLDRLEPGTATFNLPAPLRLTGPLDPGALLWALDEIVRRHESLRTLFSEHEGHGVQRVRPAAPVPLPWIDLSSLPAPVREPEARKQAGEEARLPFDLARGPLFRATLLQLGAGDWVLLATMHHIVSDGGSVEVFKRELRELYTAFAARRPSPLPELALQVPDFAAWQRSALNEASEGLLEEWKRQFGTALPDLRLPTDRPRPPIQTYRGSYRSLQLPVELSRELRRLAQRSGATLFMTLLAAFQALLHRYSGQERIVVGSPVAGRGRPELEGLIGFFVNTLVLPGDFAAGLTFRQLLERTRETALGAYACQDLPFDKLVEALQPVRDKSRSPLFQVMFLMHHEPPGSLRETAGKEGEIRIEPFDAGTDTSQFDLTLAAADTAEGLHTGVEYNTDLFDAATMDRLLEHYRSLLEAAAANPDVRLEDLPQAPLTDAPQAAAEAGTAMAVQPEAMADVRRDRLASRLSKLSPAQREALERRIKGTTAGAEPPPPAARCLVEITPAVPGTERRPFFCIHPAGGDVLCFFPLARHAGADQPFYGIQSRGLEDAGEPFSTIEEMAAHYAREIRGVQPRGPYRIGGWSFGGLAAFELGRQLRSQGEEVELLAVIDTTPGLAEGPVGDGEAGSGDPAGDHTPWLITIAEYIRGLRGKDLAVTAADLRPLDPEAQLRFFVERLRRAGVVHSGDSLAQLRRLLRVYRANVRAFRLYAPGSYDGRITLVRAEGADFDPALGPDLGWETLSPYPIDRQHVPGDHLTLLAEPHVRALAHWLRTRLGGSETS